MNDKLINRLSMYQTCLRTLNEYMSVWDGQEPQVFAAKVRQIAEAVADLEAIARKQEAGTAGATRDKRREATKLEKAAHLFGNTLAVWFSDRNDEHNAAQVGLSLSAWRRLRGQQLLEKARLVRDLAATVVDGDEAEDASFYGITRHEFETFEQEVNDYAAVIAAPQQRIAERKSRTAQLPERFNDVSQQFAVLDKLALRFRRSDAGREFVAAYQAARFVRDMGRRGLPTTSDDEELVGAGE